MEKCIINRRLEVAPKPHSLLKCSREHFEAVKELAERTNRLPMEVTDALLAFALERVEIHPEREDQYGDHAAGEI